jgi:hypothetical protein
VTLKVILWIVKRLYNITKFNDCEKDFEYPRLTKNSTQTSHEGSLSPKIPEMREKSVQACLLGNKGQSLGSTT